ncbi:TonB-dependent receptor [Litorimonas haliclonae]|uniref:TonB-dependent receptor n=1 Tax=Litorimonas haliclonae TaxID=2081977 RepID=UPI0039F13265
MTYLTRKSVIGLSASTLAIAAMIATPSAFAQTADEIVVTARRQAETLIEVPVAVSAFDENAIEELGLRSVDDVARFTAGLSFSQAYGRTTERPVIRGAANILAGVQFGVESGTAYYIDGVYYSGDLQALDTRGLERVEVTKGAQSALYGRNSYAGAINFVTKRPSKEGFGGSFETLAAEDGEYEVYGRVSNSFADERIGLALSGRYYTYDGDSAFINEEDGSQLGSEETISFNAVLDADLTDKLTVLARLGVVEDNDGPRPFRINGAEANNCFPGYRSGAYYDPNYLSFLNPPFGGIFPASPTTDNNFQYYCGSLQEFEDLAPAQSLDSGPFQGVDREMTFGTLKADYSFDSGYQLSAQFGLRDQELQTGSDSTHQSGTTFFFPISPFFSIPQADGLFYNGSKNDSFDYSGELRFSSPVDKRIRFSFGAFAYDFNEEQRSVSFSNDPDNDFISGPPTDTRFVKNQAVFGTLDFDVTDQVELSLEARYQSEEKGLQEDTGYQNSVTFKDFIPKAILSYDSNSFGNFYASYARGVKPGGINGPIGQPSFEFYEPEESDNFEIGYKARTANGKGQVTLSAFFNDISKYQLTTPVQVGTALNSVATNQGDAEIKGIEFEGNYNLTDYLTIGATYAYTDAEFTSGCDDFQFTLNSGGYLLQPFDLDDPSTQGFIRNPADLSVGAGLSAPIYDPDGLFTGNLSCSIAGKKIPMTSEHQAAIFGDVRVPLNEKLDLFVNANYTYESSKFIQVHNSQETGGTSIFGGKVGVSYNNVRFEIFGRNLFNEKTPPIGTRWFDLLEGFNTISASIPGAGQIDRNPTGPRATFLSYRRGRQVGARFAVDF